MSRRWLVLAGVGERVRLYVVDLQLGTAGTGCAGWLSVFDGLKSITLCGTRARRLLATSARQRLQLRFHANRQRQMKGFWLYYEGMDRIKPQVVGKNITIKRHRGLWKPAVQQQNRIEPIEPWFEWESHPLEYWNVTKSSQCYCH